MHHPNQIDGSILETQRQRTLEDNAPEPWCAECGGDGRHWPDCPMVEEARAFAAALALDWTIEAMERKD